MMGNVPSCLSGCVRKDGKGLTVRGVCLLESKREAVGFTECFGVRDCVEMAILEHFVTESQNKKIWDDLSDKYGEEKVQDVIVARYGEIDARAVLKRA